jgi:hypothetical protein
MKKPHIKNDDNDNIDWFINEKPIEKFLNIKKYENLIISKSDRIKSVKYFERIKKITQISNH